MSESERRESENGDSSSSSERQREARGTECRTPHPASQTATHTRLPAAHTRHTILPSSRSINWPYR